MTPATSRRRLLAAVGAGTATALAGCSDGGGDPTYEDGEIDADGEGRSVEELIAAEGVAITSPHQSATALEAIKLREHEFVLEDGYLGSTVQGVVENTGDPIDIAEVRVRVYDDAGDYLGWYLARAGDLDGGERWSFTVVVLQAPTAIASYDIAALGTPS
ncbi:FxLYD domain-containing protein [Saliphagus infecundisoli]|uniref:FxLYD domain-containing protein n=1 Tax=Saliphagus infecundisoli TaxID=1849069 RepID=A0ABD5QG54_9EURY|nr:FxLYD domain-containing protein [Saliphagus infecundisoli]